MSVKTFKQGTSQPSLQKDQLRGNDLLCEQPAVFCLTPISPISIHHFQSGLPKNKTMSLP